MTERKEPSMRTVRFGIIGCGLMGREFASAAMRWGHLPAMDVRPEIVAICDKNPDLYTWYQAHLPTVRQATEDPAALLANEEVDAVYVAVPHHLHAEIYCAALRAGKHLMGEKPFGIDLSANERIMECTAECPNVFVRCSSEFPFYPALQEIGRMIEAMTEELDIPLMSAGSTTFRRQMKQRGLEPDECYYIANERLMRDRGQHDDAEQHRDRSDP